MRKQSILLGVARSTITYKPVDEDPEDTRIKRLLDEIYMKDPCLGSRRLVTVLERDYDVKTDRKRVTRLRREMGQETIWCKPRTSIPDDGHRKYPYLLRHLAIDRPDQVRCTDISYVPMPGGHAYLCAVMDWNSRKVLGWALSNTMGPDLCLEALEKVLNPTGKVPEIFNTDQGCQFTGDNGGDGHDLWAEAQAGSVLHGLDEVLVSEGRAFFREAGFHGFLQINDHHDPGLHGSAEQSDVADPDGTIEVIAWQSLQHHPATEGEGHGEHHVSLLQRAVIDEVEKDENHHQHEREDQHHGFDETALVFELAGHLVGHAFHVDGLELLLDFLDRSRQGRGPGRLPGHRIEVGRSLRRSRWP